MMAPAPMKISVNVPTTSAISRWAMGRSIPSLLSLTDGHARLPPGGTLCIERVVGGKIYTS
jgi:hypothetical protein